MSYPQKSYDSNQFKKPYGRTCLTNTPTTQRDYINSKRPHINLYSDETNMFQKSPLQNDSNNFSQSSTNFDYIKFCMINLLTEIYQSNFFNTHSNEKDSLDYLTSCPSISLNFVELQNHSDFEYHKNKILFTNDFLEFRDYLIIFFPYFLFKGSFIITHNSRVIPLIQLKLLKDRYNTINKLEKQNVFLNNFFKVSTLPLELKRLNADINRLPSLINFQTGKNFFENNDLKSDKFEFSKRSKELFNLSENFKEPENSADNISNYLPNSSFNVPLEALNTLPNETLISNSQQNTNLDDFEISSDPYIPNYQNCSHAKIFSNKDNTIWFVEWTQEYYEISRKFCSNEDLKDAKKSAFEFFEKFPKHIREPYNTEKCIEHNLDNTHEQGRMITRQVNKEQLTKSAITNLKQENPIFSQESLNLKSRTIHNHNISSKKSPDSTLKKIHKVSKKSLKVNPGRPRVCSNIDDDNTFKGKNSTQKDYNSASYSNETIAESNFNNSESLSIIPVQDPVKARKEKLLQKAQHYPSSQYVSFECETMSWVAQYRNKVHYFLIKKHGWEKSNSLAFSCVQIWKDQYLKESFNNKKQNEEVPSDLQSQHTFNSIKHSEDSILNNPSKNLDTNNTVFMEENYIENNTKTDSFSKNIRKVNPQRAIRKEVNINYKRRKIHSLITPHIEIESLNHTHNHNMNHEILRNSEIALPPLEQIH